jgi:SAM-dependent methyltransferase
MTVDPAPYLTQLLATAPIARTLVRAAECALISGIDRPAPCLDIGCGDGSFGDAVGLGSGAVGVDLSFDAAAEALATGAYAGVIVADAARLPVRDRAVATVLANSALEHADDPAGALRELGRAARPGAVVVLTVPIPAFHDLLLGATTMRALRLRRLATTYARFFDRLSRHRHVEPSAWWVERLEAGGFVVERRRTYFGRRSMLAFDLLHWLAAPIAVPVHATLGRWVLWRRRARVLPLGRALAPLAQPGPEDGGAYALLVGRRSTASASTSP